MLQASALPADLYTAVIEYKALLTMCDILMELYYFPNDKRDLLIEKICYSEQHRQKIAKRLVQINLVSNYVAINNFQAEDPYEAESSLQCLKQALPRNEFLGVVNKTILQCIDAPTLRSVCK